MLFTVRDAIDILIVAYMIYRVIYSIQEPGLLPSKNIIVFASSVVAGR